MLDNLSAHSAPAVQRWLLRHPRVHVPFHADLRVVAEPRGALLWTADGEGAQARVAHEHPAAARRDPRLRRRRTTNAARPSSGSRPPTRSSTTCGDSDSACSRSTANDSTYPRNHRSRGLELEVAVLDSPSAFGPYPSPECTESSWALPAAPRLAHRRRSARARAAPRPRCRPLARGVHGGPHRRRSRCIARSAPSSRISASNCASH